jgi:hypothetical protein
MQQITPNNLGLAILTSKKGVKKPRHVYSLTTGHMLIQALMGKKYWLELSNNTSNRIEAVVSVDGLSIINGELASRNDPGYILSSYGNSTIPGFRLDNDNVAQFRFGAEHESYAALTKIANPESIGLIEVQFYFEKNRIHNYGTRGLEANTRGGVLTKSLGGDVGTTFGEQTRHQVTKVDFERGDSAGSIQIRYASGKKLKEYGIFVNDTFLNSNGFPADAQSVGATPPPGWTGNKR